MRTQLKACALSAFLKIEELRKTREHGGRISTFVRTERLRDGTVRELVRKDGALFECEARFFDGYIRADVEFASHALMRVGPAENTVGATVRIGFTVRITAAWSNALQAYRPYTGKEELSYADEIGISLADLEDLRRDTSAQRDNIIRLPLPRAA